MLRNKHKKLKAHQERAVSLIEALFGTVIVALGIAGGAFLLTNVRGGIHKDRTASHMMSIAKAGEQYTRTYWSFLRELPESAISSTGNLPEDEWGTASGDPFKVRKLSAQEVGAFLPQNSNVKTAPCVVSDSACGTCFTTPIGGFYIPLLAKAATESAGALSKVDLIIAAVSSTARGRTALEWRQLGEDISNRIPYGTETANPLAAKINAITNPCFSKLSSSTYVVWAHIALPIRPIIPIRPPPPSP